MGDLRARRDGSKQFGELPPKLRDRILQSKTDGFPPAYERILRGYFKKLAQETVEVDEKPAEKTDPKGN